MKKSGFALFLAFIVFSGFSAANPGPNSCGIINESYSLTEDIVSENGTCFTIAANNITLDCRGHTVTFALNETSAGKALESTGNDFVTINNCIFVEGAGATLGAAVYFQDSKKINFLHNVIQTARYGYGLGFGGILEDSLFSKNNISNVQHAVLFYGNARPARNSFSGNIVTTFGEGNIPIILHRGQNNSFEENIFSSNSMSALAIRNSNYTLIINNSFLHSGGIDLFASNETLIANNVLAVNLSALSAQETLNTRVVKNVILTTTPFVSIGFAETENSVFENNFISGVGWACVLLSNSSKSLFVNNTLVCNSGVALFGESQNTLFFDSVLKTKTSSFHFYHEQYYGNYSNSTIKLVNTTFDKTTVLFDEYTSSKLTVSWYLDVGVFGKGGVALSNASVLVKNKDGIVYSGFTDASGRIPTQTLVEYVQTAQGKNYSSPYIVSAQYKDKCDYKKTALEESTAIKLSPSRPCLSSRG